MGTSTGAAVSLKNVALAPVVQATLRPPPSLVVPSVDGGSVTLPYLPGLPPLFSLRRYGVWDVVFSRGFSCGARHGSLCFRRFHRVCYWL